MGQSHGEFGQVVRALRESLDLTQEELGHAAGYGAGAGVAISRIEAGLTRPRPQRLEALANALGVTVEWLLEESTNDAAPGGEQPSRASVRSGDEKLRNRLRRVQAEMQDRSDQVTRLVTEFNVAHDRARDEFFMPFVTLARSLKGAPVPELPSLEVEGSDGPEASASARLGLSSYGVASVLAGGAGGAVTGAAVGGAAAYGTFVAAVSFGTASTGAAIGGLSGAAATNAALALLGGGTLAAGGAGVAGGAALLAGIVAAPAVLLALGGLGWMVKRNKQQQRELAEKLDAAEADLEATRDGFDAIVKILPEATRLLDYIAVHASHALRRWERRLGDLPQEWAALSADSRASYDEFIQLAGAQLTIVSIDAQSVVSLRGEDRDEAITLANEVLVQARGVVETLV